MKHLALFLLLLATTFTATAQEELLKLGLEARVDYQRETIDGDEIDDNSGFKGKYINLIIEGNIGHGFSYAYRQRLNKANSEQSFFDATDWLYLTYTTPNERWSFMGGKFVVAIGGFEYDGAPIDNYFLSEHSSRISCYKFGVGMTHKLKNGRDSFTAQVTESPFRIDEELFAYNLLWSGKHGPLETLYSINALEWAKGEFIYYLTLGNRLTFGPVAFEFDFMNRAVDGHTLLFRDCTFIGDLSVEVCPMVKLFAKATYDVNRINSPADLCVTPQSELTRFGGGVEFFPIKGKRNVRLHAAYAHTCGSGDPEGGVLQNKQSYIDVGLTWRLNLLSFTPTKRK